MWEYNYGPSSDELYHYGIKGMKWGVRKFRKSGGSYTKKGLNVFDREMKNYETANQKVKSLKKTGDKDSRLAAKGERRAAKDKLNQAYKQVKRDYRADKGKRLYENGKTITGNMRRNMLAQAGIVVGSCVVNKMIKSSTGNARVANIATSTINIGATAVNAMIAAKTTIENRNLRAYYGHSRKK